MSNPLMPLLSLKNSDIFEPVKNETGEIVNYDFKVKYLTGSPRQYRFNMSSATVNLNGSQNITQPKDDFTFAPFAYRYFEDSLFGKEEKAWAEFFFLNEALHVCSIMVHGYTALNFKQHHADFLFYDDLSPCEVVFTIRPTEKKNEKEKTVYYIGEFKSKPITPETRDTYRNMIECLQPVYREDTYKPNRECLVEENFRLPESKAALAIRLKAEKKWDADICEEFNIEPIPDEAARTNRVLAAGARR